MNISDTIVSNIFLLLERISNISLNYRYIYKYNFIDRILIGYNNSKMNMIIFISSKLSYTYIQDLGIYENHYLDIIYHFHKDKYKI